MLEGSSIRDRAGNKNPLNDMSSKEEEGPLITQLVLKSSTGSSPCALLDKPRLSEVT